MPTVHRTGSTYSEREAHASSVAERPHCATLGRPYCLAHRPGSVCRWEFVPHIVVQLSRFNALSPVIKITKM